MINKEIKSMLAYMGEKTMDESDSVFVTWSVLKKIYEQYKTDNKGIDYSLTYYSNLEKLIDYIENETANCLQKKFAIQLLYFKVKQLYSDLIDN